MDIGLERMVVLATNADPKVRAVAAESIGEEIWQDPTKQRRAMEVGAIEVLLTIMNNQEETVDSLLPAIWSLRNVLHNNPQGQEQIAHRDAISVLTSVIQKCAFGNYQDHTEKVIEAVLACLVSAISNHERNSRRLLVVGLEAIMDIADGHLAEVTGASHLVTQTLQGEGTIALAKSILLMLGPYNYVVCRNCEKKQQLIGQACIHCGYRLRVPTNDAGDRSKHYKSSKSIKRITMNSNSNKNNGSTSATTDSLPDNSSSEERKEVTPLPSMMSQSTTNLKILKQQQQTTNDLFFEAPDMSKTAPPIVPSISNTIEERKESGGSPEKKE
jgi:uncharacterized protein (DUF2267 family)